MPRNVALIVLDTVRKDYFDEYAHRLGDRADTSFEQARAASSWSVPSHTSLFTGDLPSEHGVHAESFESGFDFSALCGQTFLSDLPDHRTAGLSANSYINTHFGVDALFDDFADFSIGSHTAESLFPEAITVQTYMDKADDSNALKRYAGFLRDCLDHDATLKSVANGLWAFAGPRIKVAPLPVPEFVDDGAGVIRDRSVEWADSEDEPWFLFANLMDAHTPLRNLIQHDRSLHDVPNSWSSTELDKWDLNKDGQASETYIENYRAVYGAAIDYLDRVVADMVDGLRTASDLETTVVVISDHGHNLGYPADDGLFHHTGSMTEGVMHTPLEIINPPAGYPSTESRLFSHLELGHLLVHIGTDREPTDDLFPPRIPAETVGLLGGDNRTWGREFSESEFAWWNRMIRCTYEGTTKYEWNSLGDRVEYRLDPKRSSWQEPADRYVEIPAPHRSLFETPIVEYKRDVSSEGQDTEFDDEVAANLKQLGYL